MRNFIIIFVSLFLLSNCTINKNIDSAAQKQNKINYPPPIGLVPFKWDYCRDKDNNRLENSNILIGLNEDNYKIFLLNWDKLIAREKQWRVIIDTENKTLE
jgi:hypothetical protein